MDKKIPYRNNKYTLNKLFKLLKFMIMLSLNKYPFCLINFNEHTHKKWIIVIYFYTCIKIFLKLF